MPALSGAFAGGVSSPSVHNTILNTSGGTGFISLYEYNIDKSSGQGTPITDANGDSNSRLGNYFSYPYIVKSSANLSWRTATSTSKTDEWTTLATGQKLLSTYPMSASISREAMTASAGSRAKMRDTDGPTSSDTTPYEPVLYTNPDGETVPVLGKPKYRRYYALRNRLNFYGLRSPHYRITGSMVYRPALELETPEWIKDQQDINLISIPSIFYGSTIKPGTVSLKWYLTGSLMAELKDIRENGELIQVSSSESSAYNDEVAGVIMYDEGLILLTGSWALDDKVSINVGQAGGAASPTWVDFAAGIEAGGPGGTSRRTVQNTAASFVSAAFGISFLGHTETQTVTMFANARRGEANFSNNPTYAAYGSKRLRLSTKRLYEENPNRLIANIASSSFANHSASFKRQVYISKVGLYDEKKNLVGVASLADPILKEEDRDFTFKLKIDM